MPASDAQLLAAVHRGDAAAARELWRRHGARLVAYARTLVRDRSGADDVVQSALCRVLRLDRRTLARVEDGSAWLTRLVRHEALNHLRAARRERARSAALSASNAGPETPPSGADEALHAAVDRLCRRLREVVVLKHVAGMTFDQIGVALGLSRNTAAARYRRAIAMLRESLDAPDAPPTKEVSHGSA
ncbi:MAG: sigma-70 family RNA polymerase sigma factor [Phycisphaerae bacterium]|nr:sigma-70 family RNA polymerase sigma factor [Phycisphaerae bacterium]